MIKLRLLASSARSAVLRHRLVAPLVVTAVLAGASVVVLDHPEPAAAFDNTYKVVAGDTLDAIAINLGIADDDMDDWVDQVVVLNDLPDANTIIEGQVLAIPVGSDDAGSEVSDGSLTPVAESQTYTVKDGDTLLGIAINLGVSDEMSWIDDVVELNGLDSADMLSIGQVLQLPADTTPADTASAESDDDADSEDTTAEDASSTESADTEATSDDSSDDSSDDTADTEATSDDSSDDSSDDTEAADGSDIPENYVVQGDNENLFDLAASLGIPDSEANAWVQATVALNNLDAKGLYPGDVIQLPQPGDY
jgi:LysM repeat protein